MARAALVALRLSVLFLPCSLQSRMRTSSSFALALLSLSRPINALQSLEAVLVRGMHRRVCSTLEACVLSVSVSELLGR